VPAAPTIVINLKSQKNILQIIGLLLSIAIALFVILSAHRPPEIVGVGTQGENARMDESRRARSGMGASFEDLLEKYSGGDRSNPKRVENYINQQMADNPFSARGVNTYATKAYGLTEDQVHEIAKAASDVRTELLLDIVEGFVQLEDPKNEQTILVFKGSSEIGNKIKNNLRERIASIVNLDFADKCIAGFQTDGSYLGGGYFDLFVYMNNSEDSNATGTRTIKIEKRNQKGELATTWESSSRNIKVSHWLDFDEIIARTLR
jgi:hypothetical protein